MVEGGVEEKKKMSEEMEKIWKRNGFEFIDKKINIWKENEEMIEWEGDEREEKKEND